MMDRPEDLESPGGGRAGGGGVGGGGVGFRVWGLGLRALRLGLRLYGFAS